MKETEDCFLKVKNDYLSFLRKEKIFDKSTKSKILSLKRIYIPISFWIENKYKKKGENFIFGFFRRARFWENNSCGNSENYFKKIF